MSQTQKTLFDKIWGRHVITTTDDGDSLLYVDRCLIHEGARHAFDRMELDGQRVRRPGQVFAFTDHYAPTANEDSGGLQVQDPAIRDMIKLQRSHAEEHGFRLFGMNHKHRGILHVVPPELGITLPGSLMVGADSHTSTHGAFGALAFGIGASETRHVLVTQTLWQRQPANMRISISGTMGYGCTAKDLILGVIAKIGAVGATGHAIEYTGDTIAGMSMEQRMTVCNMSIEAGGRAGLVAPDETLFAYLKERPWAPKGTQWDNALQFWRTLHSDDRAAFDTEVTIDAASIAPMVTWGTSPEHAEFITGLVPDPRNASTAGERADVEAALDYMDLEPGKPLDSIAVDHVFIGSCTNGRIEDLRAAAEIAQLGAARVPTWVVPGSRNVQRQAEAEGLDHVFKDAGFQWRDPGCSMCTAINGDELQAGQRCASTSNRNFQGRQGKGSRTHLVSPAMAAAAAITGKLTDVRTLTQGA